MATAKFIATIKWWYDTGRVTADYVQGLVPAKLTQEEVNYILSL